MTNKTKEELATELNKLLGTEIDFIRLTKTDMETLREAIVKLGDKTLLPFLDKPLKEVFKLDKDMTLRQLIGLPKEGGPLGLGILPRLREKANELTNKVKTVAPEKSSDPGKTASSP